ncbi:hypothetical protein [Sodalis-like endosymbiont of Proechinophthirus fluctus]|uniref:[protein-PII] uridylyltransferase family protein n=1 Tax=Sodalis-like endosymbiont of Proechinophthirus fluctus TaxID=1462730 RepID=UPI001FCABF09|nr:hypothetical protein [Sodalis-like endosymbiont of Proechinophthirus fluctus]
MKHMIAKELRQCGLKDNIKLGTGGIRKIEFIAQVFQLIRVSRKPRLQARTNDTPGIAVALLRESISKSSEADVSWVLCPCLAKHVADFLRNVAKCMLGPRGWRNAGRADAAVDGAYRLWRRGGRGV